MRTRLFLLSGLAGVMIAGAPTVSAKTFTESLQQGSSVKINIRSRFEDVTEDVLSATGQKMGEREADAWTTRGRISYQSGAWNGFSVMAEADNITEMTNDIDYRTSAAAIDPLWAQRNEVAVIADPTGTEVNQAFISYANTSNQFKYGRQRLVLDNARFIGNVGWRQNEQTYDGISWSNKALQNTNLTYAYIKNVNRVFGEDNPLLGDLHMDSHILNASYTTAPWKLIAYAYLLDVNDPLPQVDLTSETFGIRWQGTPIKLISYNFEFAKQQDAGAAQQFEADYLLAELTLAPAPYSVTVGYEVLGSDEGAYGFATPLATLHAFQGWADKFLTTPAAGLQDLYVNLGVTLGSFQVAGNFHKYEADEGNIDFGDEIGLSVVKKFGAVVWTAKYADYRMGDTNTTFTDTSKFWLMADWNF